MEIYTFPFKFKLKFKYCVELWKKRKITNLNIQNMFPYKFAAKNENTKKKNVRKI